MGRAAKKDHPERARAPPPPATSTRRERAAWGPRARPIGRSRSDAWGRPAFRPLRGPLGGSSGGFRGARREADSEGASRSDTGAAGTRTMLAASFIGSGSKPSGARSPAEPARAASRRRAAEPEGAEQRPSGSPGAPAGGGEPRWKTLVYQGFGSGPPSSGTCLHDRRQCTALASRHP